MTVPVEPGTVLADKLRIEAVIAKGGMGVLVAAHHLKLDQRVAVKFLLPEALANPEAVDRFEREARAAAKIQNEHTVRVIDVGTLDWGAPYMVMEYLRGCDLSALLSARGPMPVEDAVDYVLQASEAISEAHTLGIVHRDLKPSNLFLIERPDGTPCIKVLDFGISKVTGGSDLLEQAKMTSTGALLGSPLYMSPEQLRCSRDVDMRTDVWALGTILFELLAGRPPFVAETMPELITALQSGELPSLRMIRPDLPDGLEYAVEACLERELHRRIPSVAELAARLAPYAPKRSRVSIDRILRVSQASGLAMSVLPPPSSDPTSRNGEQTAGELVRTNRVQSRSGRRTLIGMAAVGIAGLVLATVYLAKRTPAEATRVERAASDPQVSGAQIPAAETGSVSGAPIDNGPVVSPVPSVANTATAEEDSREQPDAGKESADKRRAAAPRAPSARPPTGARVGVVPPGSARSPAAPAPTANKKDPLGGRL
ncbi:MAG: serine/threonine protein kinase [Polyangiaceae bacterium]|nr:serine/threonine protein kinase [Polyangiaceae bacterium]